MTTHEREPLTVASLTRLFDSLGVEGHTLLGGISDDAHIISQRPEGWVVAYVERGKEHSVRVWATEAEACQDLFETVTKDEHNFFACIIALTPLDAADAAWARWLSERGVVESDLASGEWKISDIPWRENVRLRRYFVRRTTIRRLDARRPTGPDPGQGRRRRLFRWRAVRRDAT